MAGERHFSGGKALTFDDVLVVPAGSSILPNEALLKTHLTKKMTINIPIVSAAMDTITEAATAIAIAREGGIGIIHKNMPPEMQAHEVEKVKRSEFWVVTNPMTISPETTIEEIKRIRAESGLHSFPVVQGGKLVGMVTNRDTLFEDCHPKKKASEIMSRDLITINRRIEFGEAKEILHKNRIEKLPIIDEKGHLKGLITISDIQKTEQFPLANRDRKGRLKVGVALGPNDDKRLEKAVEKDVDVVVIDTSHGHSKNVIDAVHRYKKAHPSLELIAGNVATAAGTKALIKAGADAVKVGVGPGAICTTRIISGVGVPQVTAIMECSRVADECNMPIIADGGIKYSGDIVKALAAGASSVMLGSLFAGCEETPGKTIFLNNRKFKQYRGMGSIEAMAAGSRDRYFQGEVLERSKLIPQGIEGVVPYKGTISEVVYQLAGGIRTGMGLTGCRTIEELRKKTKLIEISGAGMRESHPHSITITEEAPNYSPVN